MGYLIAYLLLILAVDLLHDLAKPPPRDSNVATIRRRLWNDSGFDCYSRASATKSAMKHRIGQMPIPWHVSWLPERIHSRIMLAMLRDVAVNNRAAP